MNAETLTVNTSGAAKLIGISRRHLATLKESGRLPRPIRLGRRCVWMVDDLKAWLSAGAPAADKWEAIKAANQK